MIASAAEERSAVFMKRSTRYVSAIQDVTSSLPVKSPTRQCEQIAERVCQQGNIPFEERQKESQKVYWFDA